MQVDEIEPQPKPAGQARVKAMPEFVFKRVGQRAQRDAGRQAKQRCWSGDGNPQARCVLTHTLHAGFMDKSGEPCRVDALVREFNSARQQAAPTQHGCIVCVQTAAGVHCGGQSIAECGHGNGRASAGTNQLRRQGGARAQQFAYQAGLPPAAVAATGKHECVWGVWPVRMLRWWAGGVGHRAG